MSTTWKTHLAPFATAYAATVGAIDEHVRAADEAELDALMESTSKATTTNCSWALFEVSPLVRTAVAQERYRRSRAAAAS